MPKEIDYLLERLGITQDDVEKNIEKYNMGPDEAVNFTIFERAHNPPLPGLKPGNPQDNKTVRENMRRSGMKYDNSGRDMEALTSGLGAAVAGGVGGFTVGNVPGAVAGALAGFPIGAGHSYMGNAIMDNPGEGSSYSRTLDIISPAVGGAIAKIPKLNTTAKSLTDTAVNALMSYISDEKDNEKTATDGKNSLGRAGMVGGIGLASLPAMRQMDKQLRNLHLSDELRRMGSAPGSMYGLPRGEGGKIRKVDPSAVEDKLSNLTDIYKQNPKAAGDPTLSLIRPELQGLDKAAFDSPQVKKFFKDNPEQVYRYVLDPITKAKDQTELRKNAAVFGERLQAVKLLAGNKSAVDVSKGLKNEFLSSLATNENGRFSNPDSFGMRLKAIGPEATNSIFGDPESFDKLTKLTESASKAGAIGRFMIRIGNGEIVILRPAAGKVGQMVPMDNDSKIPSIANMLTKALPTVGAAVAPGIGGAKAFGTMAAGSAVYEGYKFAIDKILDKRSRKQLETLTNGLALSGINEIEVKLSEWMAKHADEKMRLEE